jgi:hypothetical protein
MQNKKITPKFVVFSILLLLVLIFFIVPLFRYSVLDKIAIHKEINSFNLAPAFSKQKENSPSGFCFDNCPATQITYSLHPSANSTILNDLETTFRNQGYENLSKGDNSVRGTKDNGRYFVEAFTLREQTGYEGVKGDVLIDKLVIRLTYNHNL